MRVYKIQSFSKWAKKEKIHDQHLLATINEMRAGNFEVNLGGKLYKKRVALGNKGKRAGARTILAFIADDKAFFLYGFRKNQMENIETQQLNALKKLAHELLGYTEEQTKKALTDKFFYEVQQNEKERTE